MINASLASFLINRFKLMKSRGKSHLPHRFFYESYRIFDQRLEVLAKNLLRCSYKLQKDSPLRVNPFELDKSLKRVQWNKTIPLKVLRLKRQPF